MLISRPHLLKQIVPFYDDGLVKVITGMRRTGKSSLLRLIAEDKKRRGGLPENAFLFLNFELLTLSDLTDYQTLYAYIRRNPKRTELGVMRQFPSLGKPLRYLRHRVQFQAPLRRTCNAPGGSFCAFSRFSVYVCRVLSGSPGTPGQTNRSGNRPHDLVERVPSCRRHAGYYSLRGHGIGPPVFARHFREHCS